METPQLTFRIHPGILQFAIRIMEAEQNPFELKYETTYGIVGCFIMTISKPLVQENHLEGMKAIEASSQLLLNLDEAKMKHLSDIDFDYERIKSDMKALIFHVSLDQSDYKSKKKEKLVTDMLHSNLAKNLRPGIRRRSP